MADVTQLAQTALWLSVVLTLPVIGIAALVSLVMAVLQAATQVNDMTIAHLPRFVAVVVALGVFSGWMGRHLVSFTVLAFGGS